MPHFYFLPNPLGIGAVIFNSIIVISHSIGKSNSVGNQSSESLNSPVGSVRILCRNGERAFIHIGIDIIGKGIEEVGNSHLCNIIGIAVDEGGVSPVAAERAVFIHIISGHEDGAAFGLAAISFISVSAVADSVITNSIILAINILTRIAATMAKDGGCHYQGDGVKAQGAVHEMGMMC